MFYFKINSIAMNQRQEHMKTNFTDFHIPHSKRAYRPQEQESGVRRDEMRRGATACKQYNSEIIMNKPADKINFCGFLNTEKLLKSDGLKKVLDFANNQQLVFDATFALLLTCILRPLSIISLPSKKNKEDMKYASAHSIASGLIGFAISTAIFAPISSGIKKFTDTAQGKALKQAGKGLGRVPDIITAVPKGILTVALIPPILKYVFGIEKKGKKDATPAVPPLDYSLLNFKSSSLKTGQFASFKGGVY